MTTQPLKSITTESLRALIDDTEGTLSELRDELERREEQQQHAEIDQLETHMRDAESSLQTIKDFIAYLIADLRSNKS
ncbi:hypothetical protein [Halovulum sp. GXIMD14793]